MGNFYNPYSPNVDWAQGLAGTAQDIYGASVMKKLLAMMGGGMGGGMPELPPPTLGAGGITQVPLSSGIQPEGPAFMSGAGFGGGSPGGMGQGMAGMPPWLLKLLLGMQGFGGFNGIQF